MGSKRIGDLRRTAKERGSVPLRPLKPPKFLIKGPPIWVSMKLRVKEILPPAWIISTYKPKVEIRIAISFTCTPPKRVCNALARKVVNMLEKELNCELHWKIKRHRVYEQMTYRGVSLPGYYLEIKVIHGRSLNEEEIGSLKSKIREVIVKVVKNYIEKYIECFLSRSC